MKYTELKVTVKDLAENYNDNGEGGVTGYNGKLTIRPPYQREFIYDDKRRRAVIDSVLRGRPINPVYWAVTSDGEYEVLDGQQRTISISQYVHDDFAVKIDGNDKFYHNLTETEKAKIENYEVTVFICDGTEEEKLEWFQTLNIAGAVLTNQELLNATYTGKWLSDAKEIFSKRNCSAVRLSEDYMKGNSIRQDYLEAVLGWAADRDNLPSGQSYMAAHQHDADANDLWQYFQRVINWAKMLFPEPIKGITDTQEWGLLYNKYHNNSYNSNTLNDELKKLILDDEVTKNSGIIPYLLSEKTKHDEKHLSLRAFSEVQKMRAYEKQKHICPICGKEYEYKDMQGDHIVPWSKGGRTTDDNLQMLCSICNNDKTNH